MRGIRGVVAGTALLTSACGLGSNEAIHATNQEDVSHAKNAVAEATAYWASQKGAGSLIANTSFKLIEGDDSFNCNDINGVKSSDGNITKHGEDLEEGGIMFCGDNGHDDSNVIVVSAMWINSMRNTYGESTKAVITGNMHHEIGHAKYYADTDPRATHPPQTTLELQATCFAAKSMKELSSADVPIYRGVLAQTPNGGDHGGGYAQVQSFENGLNGGNC